MTLFSTDVVAPAESLPGTYNIGGGVIPDILIAHISYYTSWHQHEHNKSTIKISCSKGLK